MAPRRWPFVGSILGTRGSTNDFVPINCLDAFFGDFLDGRAVRRREVPRGICPRTRCGMGQGRDVQSTPCHFSDRRIVVDPYEFGIGPPQVVGLLHLGDALHRQVRSRKRRL